MNITNTYQLSVVVHKGKFYIEWGKVGTVEDEALHARWNAFSSKNCSGKDKNGKYYDSRKKANTVIRAFKEKEDARASREAT